MQVCGLTEFYPIHSNFIIVGGGMARISAAHQLSTVHNISDFRILEAKNRIGGRMREQEVTLMNGKYIVI